MSLPWYGTGTQVQQDWPISNLGGIETWGFNPISRAVKIVPGPGGRAHIESTLMTAGRVVIGSRNPCCRVNRAYPRVCKAVSVANSTIFSSSRRRHSQ
jgi:hypothetical protein